MTKYFGAYAATLVVMVALDMFWLGIVAKSFYQQGIGHLMAERPNVPVAVLFYAVYAAGVVVFAVAPSESTAGWTRVLVMGALFGFFAYATYDLTNLATLRNWPVALSLVDIAWGAAVSAVSAVAGKAALDRLAGG